MNKDLLGLVELQKIDAKVVELSLSKKEYPVEVEKLRRGIADAEAVVVSLNKKIDDIAAERRNVTEQIEQSKLSLERSEQRLNSITTNREYDAVHAEIENLKHMILNGESRLKTFAQDIERLEAQKQEAVKEVERVKAENQPKIDELTRKIESVDADITAIMKERSALLPTLNRQLLRTYEHVYKRRKNGRVISLVNLADGTCTICHKRLEAQLLNELRRGTRIQICESCGSLLIWNAEEAPSGKEMPETLSAEQIQAKRDAQEAAMRREEAEMMGDADS